MVEVLLRSSILPVSNVRYYYDPEIGTTLAPDSRMRWVRPGEFDNIVQTNSLGFHDSSHSWPKRGKNDFRIIVLGDSYIEGLQVPLQNTFARRLEDNLAEYYGDETIEVISLGLSGRGPSQHYRILETFGKRLEPNLIVLAVTVSNDFRDSSPVLNPAPYKPIYEISEDGKVELTRFTTPEKLSIQSILQRSATAYAIVHLSNKFAAFNEFLIDLGLLPRTVVPETETSLPANDEIPVGNAIYVQNAPEPWATAKKITFRMVAEIIRLGEFLTAPTVVFTIPIDPLIELPTADLNYARETNALDWSLPYRELKKVVAKEEAAYVDLIPRFRDRFQIAGERLRFERDGHWTIRGHEIAAAEVANAIIKEKFLD